MKNYPVIGLNMSLDKVNKYEKMGMLVPVSYVDAVADVGGVPLCIPPYKDVGMMRQILSLLDGILLIGGDDYFPEHYGGHPQPENELMPERRDLFDFTLAKFILEEMSIPVLAVCGGHQLMSIALGGRLVQDISTEWRSPSGFPALPHSGNQREESEKTAFRHCVRLAPGSLLGRIMQVSAGGTLETNSFHHQAVNPDNVGRHLRPTAWSEDGIIEAIEPTEDSPWARAGRFILGIQWHPERMQDEASHKKIFYAFVDAARNA
jgi:gamma-glutamyl-gamma-aminobutyrate hydrolase PuuD